MRSLLWLFSLIIGLTLGVAAGGAEEEQQVPPADTSYHSATEEGSYIDVGTPPKIRSWDELSDEEKEELEAMREQVKAAARTATITRQLRHITTANITSVNNTVKAAKNAKNIPQVPKY